MSRIYDNWERLVKATLLREELRWISRQDSISSSSFSSESTWSFRESDSPLVLPSSSSLSSNLGISFSYRQIALATDIFSDQNLIKRGQSGDLFMGYFKQLSRPVVVKRIQVVNLEAFSVELYFFSRINNSHSRFVPLLGHCWGADQKEKFLVYEYLPKRDLSTTLFRKLRGDIVDDDELISLDWITRLKIARGVAEALAYLHHECDPPIAHGDVQASSILLDNDFEVRLGSLNRVYAQVKDDPGIQKKKFRFPWTPRKGTSDAPPKTRLVVAPNTICTYDVYCFGKVLLELVTGKLGINSSSYTDAATIEGWLETTLPYISIYDKELVTNIVDPSLIIDEDLLEEVWAMAIVARSCLNPTPTRRPLMRYILKALENPLKVVREENNSSERLRTTSSRGSWNAALFGSWRQSSLDVTAVPVVRDPIFQNNVSSTVHLLFIYSKIMFHLLFQLLE